MLLILVNFVSLNSGAANICEQKSVVFDTSMQPITFVATFLGNSRKVKFSKQEFLDLAKGVFPHIKNAVSLYEREIHIETADGKKHWLPIQSQVLEKLNTDIKVNERIELYCRHLGSIHDEMVVVIIDYRELPQPKLY